MKSGESFPNLRRPASTPFLLHMLLTVFDMVRWARLLPVGLLGCFGNPVPGERLLRNASVNVWLVDNLDSSDACCSSIKAAEVPLAAFSSG